MNSLTAVFLFELRRIMTPGRACWWLVVAVFPLMITRLLMVSLNPPPHVTAEAIDNIYTIMLFFMVPAVSCMLGALLTAAPAVASELEQHSWVYYATRPNGLRYLLLGKYLVAVVWTATSAVTGVSAAVALSPITEKMQTLSSLILLTALSAAAYSALYLMIGTIFRSRAIVFCVAYTAGVELFLGSFPALVNRMTLQYRLRSLLYHWTMGEHTIRNEHVRELIASTDSPAVQILWLGGFLLLFLVAGLTCVRIREFTTAVETDV
ncbi:MAG: hypothetical protein KDA81_06025 [Planctomycetaceae bacterium]|nr:hypothetical protein [Planctomycetaceae bacterium]